MAPMRVRSPAESRPVLKTNCRPPQKSPRRRDYTQSGDLVCGQVRLL